MSIQPTQADLALDLNTKLKETEEAIAFLRQAGHPIPDEAHEIAGILRRAIHAEEQQKQDFLDAVNESTLSPEQKAKWWHVCFWEAVNEYAASCGGDTSNATISDRRMNAVAALEKIVGLRRGEMTRSTGEAGGLS